MLRHIIGLDHSFDSAHRVVGHEGGTGKCAHLHGHTYTVSIEVESIGPLTSEGFVVDFGVLKRVLNEWDHRTLLWSEDPLKHAFYADGWSHHVVELPFNPTSENMAAHLARRFHELLVAQGDVAQDEAQVRVTVRETAKSRASSVFPPAWPTHTTREASCGGFSLC